MSLCGLLGPHRSGKSTLAKAFSDKFDVSFVETSVSAIFKELGLSASNTPTFSERLRIQELILDRVNAIYESVDCAILTITDRTPIDMLAYTLSEAIGNVVCPEDQVRLARYAQRCFEVTNRHFCVLLLVQPGIPIVAAEGKAALNMAYMEHLSSLMFGLMMDERCSVPHYFIRRSMLDLNERVKAVDNALGRNMRANVKEVQDFLEFGGLLS